MSDDPRLDNPQQSDSGIGNWVSQELTSLSNWWHNWHPFGGPGDAKKAAPPHPTGADVHAGKPVDAPKGPAAAATPPPETMPKPDANGTLTVDFTSKFFDDAVHQPNVKKLVINHQGKADVHVEVEPDGKGGQAFWAVVDEPGVKPQDKKKFILPPDVDYITINQQKMDAQNKPVFDDKTKAPVYDPPTDRIAGQLRLQGFRNYFEAPSGGNYGGSSTLPLLRGLTSPDAPANAGQTGVDDFIKYSDHIPAAFLAQVDQQLRHDATVTNSKGVKEGTDEPWFEIMAAQVHTLQAGQELALAKGDGNPNKNQVALDRSTHEAAVVQKLTLADQDYQAAMTAANAHLSDDAKNPHLPTNGIVPRYFNKTGNVDWNDTAAQNNYYGSAKDVAAWQDRRLVQDSARLKQGIQFYDKGQESLDQLLSITAKPPAPTTKQ